MPFFLSILKIVDMETCEVKVRNEFFVAALFVEGAITDFLSERLNISNPIQSDFLGSNRGLTFNQKIDALLDNRDFSIIDKSKLSVFREVYKEFLLNKEACTIEESFTSPDSNDDFLLILYPQNDYLPREEKLINACYQLIGEVSELVSLKTQSVEVKLNRRRGWMSRAAMKVGKFASMLTLLISI